MNNLQQKFYFGKKIKKYKKHKKNSVRVEGSKWFNKNPYTLKLEGARLVGFQTISIVLIRDPHYVKNIDKWINKLKKSFYKKTKFYYLLVDHGIRKNSYQEAQKVKKLLKKESISLKIYVDKKKILKNKFIYKQ